MSPEQIGLLALFILLILITMRIPIAIALIAVGLAGNIYLQNFESAIVQFQLVSWEVASNFVLVTLPIFIWMGALAQVSGLGRDLFECFNRWFGRIPGGLAMTSISCSATFGAVTGSSVATVTAMGKMLMPEMRRYGYNHALATGSISAAGVLAILIPPSIPLVFYAAWTETSLGDLFIAGIIPGVLLAVMFSIYVLVRCMLKPELAPGGQHYSLSEKVAVLPKLFPAMSLMLIVLGSIYGGYTTPTEAASVGLAWVFLLGLIRKRISMTILKESIAQSTLLSGNIFLLFLGGVFFSRFMAQTDVTELLVENIATLGSSSLSVMLGLLVLYLILGAVLDTFGMIILTLPFVFPLVTSLGYDPVWFGIFIVMMIELSLITPPIGINVFVMQRVAPEIPLMTVFKGALPFVLISLLMVLLLLAFPQIALWLPAQMNT
jgi:tripartite ATP-independent transporter DctM subunit